MEKFPVTRPCQPFRTLKVAVINAPRSSGLSLSIQTKDDLSNFAPIGAFFV